LRWLNGYVEIIVVLVLLLLLLLLLWVPITEL
jgi:hypothetical protein